MFCRRSFVKFVGGLGAGVALASLASVLPPGVPGAPTMAGAAGGYSTGAPGEMKNGDATLVRWKRFKTPVWTGVTGSAERVGDEGPTGGPGWQVTGTNAQKIKGTAIMADACSVLDISTGAYVDCDFVIAFEAVECYPVGVEVRPGGTGTSVTPDGDVYFKIGTFDGGEQEESGRFCPYTCTMGGIKDCKVTYKFVRKDTGKVIPANRFSYWFSSMNPGEGVGVNSADGCSITKTVVTSDGLRNYPDLMRYQKSDDMSKSKSYMGSSSMVDQSTGSYKRYVGGPWLTLEVAGAKRWVDIADLNQDLRLPSGGSALTQGDVRQVGSTVVFGSHKWSGTTVQCWRAISLELAGEGGAIFHYYQDPSMMERTDINYYWVLSFLSVLDTPAPSPVKKVVAAEGELEHVQPGERVNYTVSHHLVVLSKELAPSKVTFVDHMPTEVDYKKAVMKIDGKDVTESLGELVYDHASGRRDLIWEMDMSAFLAKHPDDGDYPLFCDFSWEIEGRVASHCEAGITVTNVANIMIDNREEGSCERAFKTDVPVLGVTKTVI